MAEEKVTEELTPLQCIRRAFPECELAEIKILITSITQEDKLSFAKDCADYLKVKMVTK